MKLEDEDCQMAKTTRSSDEIKNCAPLRGFPASFRTTCTLCNVHVVQSALRGRHCTALDGPAESMGKEEKGEEVRMVGEVFMPAGLGSIAARADVGGVDVGWVEEVCR